MTRHRAIRARGWLTLLMAAVISACAPTSPTVLVTPIPTAASTSLPTDPSAGSPQPTAVEATPPPLPATPSPGATATLTAPPTAPPRWGDDPEMATALQTLLERARDLRRIPGLAAMVTFPDGSTWTGAAGLAQLEEGVVATPTTRFSVGSITKTFVAALILQLAEEGRLGLDDPLGRTVPDFPNSQHITLRQLLSHTSGVYNYFENPAFNTRVFSQPAKRWTVKEILALVKAPYFAPGAGYHYSNTNFVLLGLVAEKVTGASLASEIRRRFLDPLELHDTAFQGSEELPRTTAAHGYLLLGGRYQGPWDGSPIEPDTSAVTVAWAAGAMTSSVADLSRWANALYAGAVLAPESLAAMLTFDRASGYGLGTRTDTFELQRAVGHTGSLRGFTNAMWYMPDVRMTVVVSTNLGRINVNPIVGNLVRGAFRRLGIPIVPSATPKPGTSSTPGVPGGASATP